MSKRKFLNIKGTLLDDEQLVSYLEKKASEDILQIKSDKNTYPVPRLINNFMQITKTYEFLNNNLKLGIDIHPAGEWLLDNYYIIEETYKTIRKELSFKKYIKFAGISNGEYKGFARIYVLASDIVAYSEGKINGEKLKNFLNAYQRKKILDMDEIWNIGIFLNIALIEKIKDVCEKIYFVQIQKYKVESIIERLVENRKNRDLVYKKNVNNIKLPFEKDSFIEYMSYRLNKFGKNGLAYIDILKNQVEKAGNTIQDIVNKEHFDIALKKVSIGNCIISIKEIQRINLTEIVEEISGVENILKKDPAEVYKKMTYKTKEYYRGKIKELSIKNNISEIYIANKALELAKRNMKDLNKKKSHIGYYIIDKGIDELNKELNIKIERKFLKGKIYIFSIISITSIINLLFSFLFLKIVNSIVATIIFIFIFYIPISEIIIKIIQYIFAKKQKQKFIPKIDFSKGITKENATMVIVPTIIKNSEDIKKMFEKLEIYYWANKSDNIYFTLLGDCTTSAREVEEFDEKLVEEGKLIVENLNKKYSKEDNIFNFVYRKRLWNDKEKCFLGWERKRGLITEFNKFLLGNNNNSFKYNSLENESVPKIKYVITLDSDTNLILDSANKLIGGMAHILNEPVLDKNKNIVIDGYGILQPRVEIDLNSSRETLFTKIYAGLGGIDSYSNASSDIYQDNFFEGTFTGKGIYNLQVFNKVLENSIPENTVLSHDLLEGIYARCGLSTDVVLVDSYPSKFNSYIARNSRWIRGDWQIIRWLCKKIIDTNGNKINNPISELSKYKILDNLRRSLLEITQVRCLIFLLFFNQYNINPFYTIIFLSIFIDFFIDLLNTIIFRKEGVKKQSSFENKLPGLRLSIVRAVINFSSIIYRAIVSIKAIYVTLFRMCISKEHLLEWVTSDEIEKRSKENIQDYFKEMIFNVLAGIFTFIVATIFKNILTLIISILWMISPIICWYISKVIKEEKKLKQLNLKEKKEIIELAKRTWKYFEDNLIPENNFIPPDNYQENRKEEVVNRSSSTNIGLGLISIISAYDLKFIDLEKALYLVNNLINTIRKLKKWNGHLYNWYNINTLDTLKPEYISTVDSGNFIGYLIIVKIFLEKIEDKEIKDKFFIKENIEYIEQLIKDTDFSKLYNSKIGLFSIGFSIDENKLTDSYYDLLASEARQASFIAIAKKDVEQIHWSNLSRTLTTMDGKKGLISWSGTAFEYFMPNINMKKYKGSLLDESYKFVIMSQKKYCERLGIPWGISESAFNLKDLESNYQYKAFGVPWLGLKRGLTDEIVVSSYGSILAITEEPKEVLKNIKLLKEYNMYGKYGLYESIDFTPERLSLNKKYDVVKTYMAHHQALILLSINNLINNNILQKRFYEEPQIKSVDILLQEKLPEDITITKEKKEKISKIKYKGYNGSYYREIINLKSKTPDLNIISNKDYMNCMLKNGTGYSKYKNILINRYKQTDENKQGILFFIKNKKDKSIFSSLNGDKIIFTSNSSEIVGKINNIEVHIKTIVSSNDNVEIRNVKLKNISNLDEVLEVSSVLEPVLSEEKQDYSHKAFNNLFLKYEKIDNGILIKRNKRGNINSVYMAIGFFSNKGNIENLEYEINKEKLYGRQNIDIPEKIKNSEKFSNNIGLVVDPIMAFRRTIKIQKNEEIEINLVLSVSEDVDVAIEKLNEYKSFDNIGNIFEISFVRNEETAKYLQITGNDMVIYQKMLSYLLFLNPLRKKYIDKFKNYQFKQEDLWKYGISDNYPILLIKISAINYIYIIKELLKALKYFQNKNILVDFVILSEEKNSSDKIIYSEILKEIIDNNLSHLINSRIFVINLKEIDNVDILEFKANLIIDAKKGSLENILLECEEDYLEKESKIYEEELNFEKFDINKLNLKYKNGYGGFSEDGTEYIISVDKNIPSVWCNILANPNFGTIVTQNLGGFSWHKNSRLNRISKWSNDTIFDISSEDIFIQDKKENKFWKLGKANVLVTNGFGYSKFEQKKKDIVQKLDVFVSTKDNVKINLFTIKNNTNNIKHLSLIYKIDTVLDEDEIKSNGNIITRFNKKDNIIYSKNLFSSEMNSIAYITCSETIESYTGNVNSINIFNNESLNFESAIGNKPCMAIKIDFEIKAFEEKEITLVLGAEDGINDFKLKYKDINICKDEYKNTVNYWNNLLNGVKVKTPVDSLNIMLNGWCIYQDIVCRLYAKSGFYQSGGAYGFRDQLQDVLALKFVDVEMMKKQILKHAQHQFIEGDVEHWWHEETQKGIRTRFSDDRLWLIYVIIQYIKFTGDKEILNKEISYVEGKILEYGQDEDYSVHSKNEILETLYEHCIRAIEISLKFGEHYLPLIGSGDWNDGFSTVGNKGKGESVWLGFFIYYILNEFMDYINEEELKDKYKKILTKLKQSLNNEGWDGNWYKRAYTDNGEVIGSIENDEAKIDAIAQSWSVISEAGEKEKKYIAMESLENNLIDNENKIIKLLSPPFENTKIEPGYIKSYLPGVRENGGQYTHG